MTRADLVDAMHVGGSPTTLASVESKVTGGTSGLAFVPAAMIAIEVDTVHITTPRPAQARRR